MIINGELSTGLGGGICQVSTTVFNAAYEAGLPITSRTNHALYISHYPLGRDATVNYPDIDLKFVNDTGKWLLLRTFVGSSSLVVNLYGAPQHRRVETETAPLRVVGAGAGGEGARQVGCAGAARGRGVRRPGASDVGAPAGLLAERQAALGCDLVLELPVRAEDRPDRAEEEEAAEADAKPADAEPAVTPTGPTPPQ